MSFILGIDTGGTFTDAVIYDTAEKKVISKKKVLTTNYDLTVCISQVVSELAQEKLKQISSVSLSTTLATNACIEGIGAKAKLIIIGGDKKIISERYKEFNLPEPDDIIFIEGKINLNGEAEQIPDWQQVKNILCHEIKTNNNFAIAGMLASRNPIFEYTVRDMLLTLGCTAVCSTSLAENELNYLKRASSTYLNAQLIPLVQYFINSVKKSLDKIGISVPIHIVRSDGGLMNTSYAKLYPVETLLSGPAASCLGAAHLTGYKNAVICDIGGTTCDLAIIRGGVPVYGAGGIKINTWQTTVEAVKVNTFGLGGDSRITLDGNASLVIGPGRVIPLCVLAADYPDIVDDIKRMADHKYQGLARKYEFFKFVKEPDENEKLSNRDLKIINLLKNHPMAADILAESVGVDIFALKTEHLEKRGYIIRSGFTPTDIMHITGDFKQYNEMASIEAAVYFTRILNCKIDKLCEMIIDLASKMLYSGIVKLMMGEAYPNLSNDINYYDKLIEASYEKHDNGFFYNNNKLEVPIVGVGAPTHIFLYKTADKLNCKAVITDNSSVANAVGAAISCISVIRSLEIRPSYSAAGLDGYYILGLPENPYFTSKTRAIEKAKEEIQKIAITEAKDRGLIGEAEIKITIDDNDSIAVTDAGILKVELGTVVRAEIINNII